MGGSDALLILVSINRLISVISQQSPRANSHFGSRALAIMGCYSQSGYMSDRISPEIGLSYLGCKK